MKEDISPLDVPGIKNQLYISSRPGFGSPHPSREIEPFIERIAGMGISRVMVLMPDYELYDAYGANLLDVYREASLEVLHCPIRDFGVPEQIPGSGGYDKTIQDLLEALVQGPVLLHCAAGLGRSGLTAACLLVKTGLSSDEAIERVRRARPGTIQTAEQEKFVRRYEESI